MSRPVISILLPVRDAAETLPACLRSIERQDETGWECVIVDDGSRDASLSVARRFADRDPRFRLLARPHEGLVASLNAGLDACQGRYVARMDADDLMHRRRLARQRRALEADDGLAAVGCHVRLFPRSTLGDGMRAYEGWLCGLESEADVARDVFIECPLAHPSLFARCDFLGDLGYRDEGWPEDYDLVLRAHARGLRLGVVPERLLSWRRSEGRLSATHPAYAIERFVACKAHFLADGFLARTDSYVLWGYGGTGRALRKALAERGRHPSHIVELHPGRLGQSIHGARVIAPDALPTSPTRPLLVSVAGASARKQIRDALARSSLREGHDFICAA